MRITRIEAVPVAVPLAEAFHWQGGAQVGANLVLFSVHTDDGAVVVGRRGENLLDADPPVRVREDDVGERAPDVGADPPPSRSDGSSSQIRSTAHCIDSWMTLCAALESPALQAS